MKYALTKNSTIAEPPGPKVKIFQHSQCGSNLLQIEKGENKGQWQCQNCFKTGYLVKKLSKPKF